MVKCNVCKQKSRTNYTHGSKSKSDTYLKHDVTCPNKNKEQNKDKLSKKRR